MSIQTERPFRVKSSLGEDALLLDRFQGEERISTPFRYVARVLADDPALDINGLLYKPLVLSFNLDQGEERHIHSYINRIRLLERSDDGRASFEVELVPWLWFLSLYTNHRIYQNKTVPQIIEQVFKDRGFSDFKLQLQGSFEQRDYVVQYGETDLNFVSRLMEDEGIFYFFQQSEQKHTLMLANAPSAFSPCPRKPRARYQGTTGGHYDEDGVLGFEYQVAVQPGKSFLNDYDFEKPNVSLASTESSQQKGELYEYPGKYKTRDEGKRYAGIRLEEQEAQITSADGTSNCLGFECGYAFTLEDYYREEANQDWTIVALQQSGVNTAYESGGGEPFRYENRFQAIPKSVKFHPPRVSARPRIYGTQTAVIVGPSGEEIYTDKYGRVKVQFFWDREGRRDANSSCWIRVAQGWAGKQWGSIFTPRIGQEVVVSFLEGDPDRPLITGSVYNAEQMPPYELPGEQTKSTVKSMSSKGGGGFNELRFEDKKGSEQIYIHGEKDVDIRVKNDRKELIQRDRHLIVERDRFSKINRDEHSDIARDHVEKLGRDHHVDIGGKQAISVSGSVSISVTGDVNEQFKSNHSCQVTNSLYLKATQIVIEATAGITLKVGSNFITIDPSGVAVKGTLIQLNSAGAALSGSAGSLVSPLAATAAQEPVKADPGAMAAAVSGATVSPDSLELEAVTPARRSPASDAPTHNANALAAKKKPHWIEIELVDEEGQPVPGEPYKITLPDGTTVADGTLDEKGFARVDGIDPGTCKVTFPNLDKDAWEKT